MKDFFKRNLVWVAIFLCITGVVLSIIGIPANKPILFFIGIVLSLPTIGYLIYQVFFSREKTEIDLKPATNKISTSNITSIVANKQDVLLQNDITTEDDLEPLYNGYASEDEIAKRLSEITDNERKDDVIELPNIDLPMVELNHTLDNTTAVQILTNEELSSQRDIAANTPLTLTPEVIGDNTVFEEDNEKSAVTEDTVETDAPIVYTVDNNDNYVEYFKDNESLVSTTEQEEPTEPVSKSITADSVTPINEDENLSFTEEQYEAPSLDDPNFVLENEPSQIQNDIPTEITPTSEKNIATVDLTNAKIVYIDPKQKELRQRKVQEKKVLLAQENLERYFKRYFIETAACFLMDRTMYKDKNGVAPYNKFAVNKDTNLPEYSMSMTKGRLYKFCTYLIDTERFIKHSNLYNDFITEVERGVPLARISETLHPLYRKKYRKDFVLNLSNREDWDNVLILVYNNYLLSNNNFKNVFTHIPFEIPFAYSDENIIDYLKDIDVQDRFAENYTALEDMGIPTFWEAIYICFINSIKQKLSIQQIENALLRDYKKIARALKRADNTRRKQLKKAS